MPSIACCPAQGVATKDAMLLLDRGQWDFEIGFVGVQVASEAARPSPQKSPRSLAPLPKRRAFSLLPDYSFVAHWQRRAS